MMTWRKISDVHHVGVRENAEKADQNVSHIKIDTFRIF